MICNPIGSDKVDRVLALLDLPPGARVLDVGCGKAEMLMRLIERYGATAVGVDTNAEFLAEARAHAFDRGVAGQLELILGQIQNQRFAADSFDAALCVGATHAYGDFATTIDALSKLVKSGGKVLVGEAYWMQKPDTAYLKALGAKAKDYTDHGGNVAAGVEAKLVYLYSVVADADDRDDYEGLYNRAVETWCLENPKDPDHNAARKKIRDWRDLYLNGGRDTLGFGLYLFQK